MTETVKIDRPEDSLRAMGIAQIDTRLSCLLEQVLQYERSAKREGQPGLPMIQIPLASAPAMHMAIANGLLTRHSRPGRVRLDRMIDYLALTEKGRKLT